MSNISHSVIALFLLQVDVHHINRSISKPGTSITAWGDGSTVWPAVSFRVPLFSLLSHMFFQVPDCTSDLVRKNKTHTHTHTQDCVMPLRCQDLSLSEASICSPDKREEGILCTKSPINGGPHFTFFIPNPW